MLHVVLVEPEIPQNTGNIARTCAATGAQLHLVGKLGFSLDEKYCKRAGLDYWPFASVLQHASFGELQQQNPHARFYFYTTKAPCAYSQAQFSPGEHFLVFGKETKGLPEDLLRANKEHCYRIPMREGARSLNLSNAVAIALYDALRQQNFAGLESQGTLPEA